MFNRIHVADISAAIAAVIAYDGPGEIWNLSDDEPSPPQDVVTYAASLMGVEPPPEQAIEIANLTPMGRSFYAENKRAANGKLKETRDHACLSKLSRWARSTLGQWRGTRLK